MIAKAELALLPEEYRGRAQTFVKHQVLRHYLDRAAMTLLSGWDDFVFIDGFSGPWKNAKEDYSDTSFGIAIDRLRKARENWATQGKVKNVRCVFVEQREAAFNRLNAATKSLDDLECTPLHGQFEEHVGRIREIAGNKAFTLTFVDPTGWSFDLQRLAPLLQRRPGEVLVNFMYEHFRRFIDDQRADIRASQDRAFGGPGWRERYSALIAQGLTKEDAVLEVFKYQLRKVCGFDYVASARVRHPLKSQTHFYLVYGTRHVKGLVKFRDAEKEALRSEESYRLQSRDQAVESRTGQQLLFGGIEVSGGNNLIDPRKDDHRLLEGWLLRVLPKNTYDYEKLATSALERFSVTESEFKDVLVEFQQRGIIIFEGMGLKQRKPNKGITISSRAAA